jgi:hypothetical protein
MHQSTELARGKITRAHVLTVTLEESDTEPPAVLIHWPDQASVTTPYQLRATVNRAMNILARASVRLTHIKRERRI